MLSPLSKTLSPANLAAEVEAEFAWRCNSVISLASPLGAAARAPETKMSPVGDPLPPVPGGITRNKKPRKGCLGGWTTTSTHKMERAQRRVAEGTLPRAAWLQSSSRRRHRQGSGQDPPGRPGLGAAAISSASRRSRQPGRGRPMAEQARPGVAGQRGRGWPQAWGRAQASPLRPLASQLGAGSGASGVSAIKRIYTRIEQNYSLCLRTCPSRGFTASRRGVVPPFSIAPCEMLHFASHLDFSKFSIQPPDFVSPSPFPLKSSPSISCLLEQVTLFLFFSVKQTTLLSFQEPSQTIPVALP